MAVKIVTDSTSDISPELAQGLDIRIVPIYFQFGSEVYRDGIDITDDEFYSRLATSPVHPTTSQPGPEDFTRAFNDCLEGADGVVSIHISSKISGTYNTALLAKKPSIVISPSRSSIRCSIPPGYGWWLQPRHV